MRPAAYLQAGYFPLHPEFAKVAAMQLSTDRPEMVAVLDPCVGEGHAVKIILDYLGITLDNLQAVEIAPNRGEQAAENLSGADVIYPACFVYGCNRPERAYTFCYANPPFAAAPGGGRMESLFLDKISHTMPIGSVLCMVVPYSTLTNRSFENTLGQYWRRVRVVNPIHLSHAPYNERLVLAIRHNNKPVAGSHYIVQFEDERLTLRQQYAHAGVVTTNPEPKGSPFIIPPIGVIERPLRKVALTEEEICVELLRSPIEQELRTPPPISRGRPPLALNTGHNGMLVASGQAPPVVVRRDSQGRMIEVPHLVRGVARKSKYIRSEQEEDLGKGKYRTRTVISEAVDLRISVLLHTGELIDLNQDRDAVPVDEKGNPIPKQTVQLLSTKEGSSRGGIAV